MAINQEFSARTRPRRLNRTARDHAATPSSSYHEDGAETMIQLWRDAPPQFDLCAVCHLDGVKQPGETTRPTTARARSSSARCGARPATASYIRPGVWRLKCVRCTSSNFEALHRRRSRGGVVPKSRASLVPASGHTLCRLRKCAGFFLRSTCERVCEYFLFHDHSQKPRLRQTRAIRSPVGAADDAPGPCPPRLSGDTSSEPREYPMNGTEQTDPSVFFGPLALQ